MFKKELKSRLLVTLVWLVVVTLLRWHWYWDLVGLWLGGLLGTFLLDLDHFLYLLVIYPHELTGMRLRRFLEQGRFGQAFSLVAETRGERIRLSFHNALFQVALWILCFFAITSTTGLLGAGLTMAMALGLMKEEIESLLKKKEEELRKRLFWPIKAEISLREQKFFIIFMLLLFVGLSLLLI